MKRMKNIVIVILAALTEISSLTSIPVVRAAEVELEDLSEEICLIEQEKVEMDLDASVTFEEEEIMTDEDIFEEVWEDSDSVFDDIIQENEEVDFSADVETEEPWETLEEDAEILLETEFWEETEEQEGLPEEETERDEWIEEDLADRMAGSGSGFTLNANEITLYALDPSIDLIKIPENNPNIQKSFQIRISGTSEQPSYKVSKKGVQVNSNGCIVPELIETLVIGGGGQSKQQKYSYGDYTVTVQVGTSKQEILVHLKPYDKLYAETKMKDFIKANIKPGMTQYQKAEVICNWISKNFGYSVSYSGYTGLMIYGAGDCWANTDAVNFMCNEVGIRAYSHGDTNLSLFGGGHMNTLASLDGEDYILECGFSEAVPRHYTITKLSQPYTYKNREDGTIKIERYVGTSVDPVVPETINGKAVTELGENSFQKACVQITSVKLPKTLKQIDHGAFYGCAELKKVTIPASVTMITGNPFVASSQSSLQEINVESGNTVYYSQKGVLFERKSKKLIAYPAAKAGPYKVPAGTAEIGPNAFYQANNLQSVELPSSVGKIDGGAFMYSVCSDVRLNEGLKLIEVQAFNNTKGLRSLTIPASVEEVQERAFVGGLYSVKFLGRNTKLHENCILSASIKISGWPGSTAATFAKSSVGEKGKANPFFAIQADGKVRLDPNWFEIADSRSYQGAPIEQQIWKKKDAPVLYEGIDYEVHYKNNVNVGTASAVLTGIGIFQDSIELNFEITPVNPFLHAYYSYESNYSKIYFAESGNRKLNLTATGNALEPEVVVEGYTRGSEYEITWENNRKPGQATAHLRGIGNYSGKLDLTFHIYGTLPEVDKIPDQVYTGASLRPDISIAGLETKDYSVTYENNINVGNAKVTVSGRGWYKGERTVTFRILPKQLPETQIGGESYVYTGEEIRPRIYLPGVYTRDYDVAYENNVNVGEGKIKVTGKGNYCGKIEGSFSICAKRLPWIASSYLDNQTYTGRAICPQIRIEGVTRNDYSVAYENNIDPGYAKAIITGKGNYTGQQILYFLITDREDSEEKTIGVPEEKTENIIPGNHAGYQKHTWTNWKVTREATVFTTGEKLRTCRECGVTERKELKRLTATCNLNQSTITISPKQSVSNIQVVELAKGDYVKKWSSSNKSVASVNSNGVIKGIKAGKAIITVTLASGKKASVTVQVKKPAVKKITGVPKKITLKKKKHYVLKLVLNPAGATGKVTYKSSNKKVAVVNAKGKITAKKKGTAVITVSCGKVKVKCKVRVK